MQNNHVKVVVMNEFPNCVPIFLVACYIHMLVSKIEQSKPHVCVSGIKIRKGRNGYFKVLLQHFKPLRINPFADRS